MRYGLIGEHLPHSFSAEIHEALGRYSYTLKELAPQELASFMQARNFRGINVTIPYKQAVIPYLDELDETAAQIGAVNTIVNRGGRLYGYNTDFRGMVFLFARTGVFPEEQKVLILGTGGTAHTAEAVVQTLGAREIHFVSRTKREGAITYEEAKQFHSDAELLINTTPVGMYPHSDESPIDLAAFPRLTGVLDAIYNPLRTRLVQQAQVRGIPAAGGLYMLVQQAVKACERFTDRPVDREIAERVYERLLRKKQNLVLIGMPGSGKSTVGKLLSQETGQLFIDIDAKIERRAGMPITEIFSKFGEEHFRDMESAVIRELSERGGRILATGGGSILREENVAALRQNGKLYFLDRPLADLLPTADRPLGNSRAKLERLYRERYELYLACADRHIPVSATPELTAARILRLEAYL